MIILTSSLCLSHATLAMFGFLPQYVDDSLKNLLIYNALPVEIKFDSNGVKQTNTQMVKYNFVSWVKYLLILGLYSSLLQTYDYEPYPKEEGPAVQDIKLGTGFSRGQLVNNMLIACKCEQIVFVSMHSCGVFLHHVIFHTVLFQIYLTTFGFGLSFIASLTGVQLIPFMLNPIFESSSPSDFWGRRWNLVGKYASP